MKLTMQCQCQCMKKAVRDLSRESLDFTESIIDVRRIFASECNLVRTHSLSPKESTSEPNILYTVNYDDLCGPWPSPTHPTFKEYDDVTLEPMLCTGKFITIQDIRLMKQHLFDKDAIGSIIERRLPNAVIFEGKGKDVFLSFAWEIFKYMRDNDFSGKGVSAILGLFYMTHRFFLSNTWRSARETFAFFRDGLDLHAVLKPPESDMIFNFSECDKLLDMFWSLYIQKLELVRSVCIPNFNLLLKKKCGVESQEKLLALINLESQK